jgi:cytosine/adenosine deaminase-related metal-dependent hydrolase
LLELAAARLKPEQIWVNPDCGLKTRKWQEVKPALAAMIDAAKQTANGDPAAKIHIPGAREAWWRITAGNAAALGLNDHGLLAPGCEADLVIARPSKPWRQSVDPLAMLLYGWDDRWITSVLSSGRIEYSAR